MKNKIRFRVAMVPCHLKCSRDQLGAVLFGYLMRNDLSRKKIQDHADIEIAILELKASNIADPNLVWPVRFELLLEDILFLF